jgi:L-amino acid N-acyltransferase YncA
MRIEPAVRTDWADIKRIYIDGIRTGHATFQTVADAPDCDTWFAGKISGLIFKAVDDDGRMLAWAALSRVSSRRVYVGVAEVSIYVAPEAWRKGIGGKLLTHLVNASEAAGVWTLQAGIFPENQTSIRLHEKAGFRIVGLREKLGRMNGIWRDVVLMERRSSNV